MKISIIVPIYNVEKFIQECIYSLVNQTYKNIEIILVNDKTMDNTINLIKPLLVDNRIIVLEHEVNRGLSAARNTGVSFATGDYILFVDSDDYISFDCVEKLVNEAIIHSADVVQFGFTKIDECSNLILTDYIEYKPHIPEKEYSLALMSCVAWNKLLRRELAIKYLFPEGLNHEDLFTMPKIIDDSEKVRIIKDKLYFYRQREGSIRNLTNKNKEVRFDIICNLIQYSIDKYGYVTPEFSSLIFRSSLLVAFETLYRKGYKNRLYFLKLSKKNIIKTYRHIKHTPYFNEMIPTAKRKILLFSIMVPFSQYILAMYRFKRKINI